MAEKIKIAELSFDTSAILKSTADLKKEIDKLNASQKSLDKTTREGREQFVKNTTDLKILKKEYTSNTNALASNREAIKDNATQTELLALALSDEVKSIEEARNQNKLLNKIRNETNITTTEGQEQLSLLNNKLDANNEFIKENADAYLQQKINVGNYKDSITEALGELNLMNGGIGGFISRSQEAGGAGNLLKSSLGGAAKGMLGMAKASLAFIATPIGAVLAAIVLAFALVKNAMGRSEEATNKITKIFKTFSGIVSRLLKFLEPLGTFLIDTLVVGFELAGQAAEKALDIISDGLSFLGFDDAAKGVKEFKKEMVDASKAAQTLADAEASLQKSQRESRKIQLDFQKDAEKLRQIRDDETKSFAQRQKANEELGGVLKKQQDEELRIAIQGLKVANLRIDAEGERTDLLDARAEALAEISDIQERITGQESEQIVNRVSLQKEANDKAIEQQKGLLDLFIAQQGIKARTLEEEVVLAEQVSKKKINILKAELRNRKITKEQFDAAVKQEENTLAQTRVDLVVGNAQRELDIYINNNQSKLDSDKFFSDESLKVEKKRINDIAKEQRANELVRLEAGVITQTEYNDAINLIDDENRLKLSEADLLRKEAKTGADLIDLENQRILDEEKFTTQFALETERENIRYNAEIAAAEKTGADTDLIDKKHAAIKKKINKAAADNKLQLASDALGNLATIAGKESDVGKAAAVAQTTIDTYRAAQSSYTSLSGIPIVGPVLGALAAGAAVASGLANVKKITGTNAKFEAGGLQEIGGSRHSGGGTKFQGEDGTQFEAERGELIGVMNRNAAQHFMNFNDSFPNGGSTPTFFQGGGIISQGVSSQSIDTSELASLTVDAIAQIPAPIVTVEDINAGQISTAEVVSGANL